MVISGTSGYQISMPMVMLTGRCDLLLVFYIVILSLDVSSVEL